MGVSPQSGDDSPLTEGVLPMRWGVVLALIFVVSLAVRVAVVSDLADLPSQVDLVEDARAYDATARSLLANGWIPERAFYQAPLYPYFVAACYRIAGAEPMVVRLVQALLGAVAVVLLAGVGRKLGGARVGLLSGLLAALYVPYLFYVPLLLKPTLLLLVEALLLYLLLCLGESRPPWLVAAIGASLGLSMLVRGNMVLIVPFLLVWWLADFMRREPSSPRPWRRLVGELALLAVGFLAAVSPISWVNYRASGDFVMSSSQSGSNYYIGNRYGASGIYQPLRPGRETPELEQEDARVVAADIIRRETGVASAPEELAPSEVSRAFWRQSGRDIVDHPGSWLRLQGRKLLLFWNDYEIPDAENLYVYRPESGWLRWNPLLFGLIAPLGLLGLAVLWRQTGNWLLAALVAGSMLSVVLFYNFGRYRLPVVAFLIPAAAFGVVWMLQAFREGRFHQLGVCVAAVLALVLFVRLPVVSAEYKIGQESVAHFNMGVAANRLLKQNIPVDREAADAWAESATVHLETSRRLDPTFVPAWVEEAVLKLRRGTLAHREGRLVEARGEYVEAERWLAEAEAMPRADEFAHMLNLARDSLMPSIWAGHAAVAMDIGAALLAAGDRAGATGALDEAAQVIGFLNSAPVMDSTSDDSTEAGPTAELWRRLAELRRRLQEG